MKARFLIIAVVAALLAGCFKKVAYRTTYVLKPLVERVSGDIKQPLAGAVAYAYDVDTTLWTVVSYDDALRGVLTSKENPSEKRSDPVATAEPYELEGTVGWLQMPLVRPSQMVLAVDTGNRIYAYTQQPLPENLPQLTVSLLFQPWKAGNRYQSGAWSFFNEFYEPPTYVECTIVPEFQSAEGGDTAPVPTVTAYAFAADTAYWYIASYEDALKGKITSKNDPAQIRDVPNFTARKDGDRNAYVMSVSAAELMVVVVDRTHERYAYTRREVLLDGEPQTFPVLFRIWIEQWHTEEEGWLVVDPALEPEPAEPEPPQTASTNRR